MHGNAGGDEVGCHHGHSDAEIGVHAVFKLESRSSHDFFSHQIRRFRGRCRGRLFPENGEEKNLKSIGVRDKMGGQEQ